MTVDQRAVITTCVPKDKTGPHYATCRTTSLQNCRFLYVGGRICEISSSITVGTEIFCSGTLTSNMLPGPTTYFLGSGDQLFTFPAFTINGDSTGCFSEPYTVVAGSGQSSYITYPPSSTNINTCDSYTKCLQILIKTLAKTTINLTITGRTASGASTFGNANINIVCGPESTEI